MENIVVGLIILAIIIAASYKIYSEKKKGAKCIGCPHSGGSTSSGQGCGCK